MIELKCPTCRHQLRIRNEFAGKRGQCKYCKTPIAVPFERTAQISSQSDYSGNDLEPEVPSVEKQRSALGLAAVALGIGAVLLSTIPVAGLASPLLAAAGVTCGFVALATATKSGTVGVGAPIAGSIVSVVALFGSTAWVLVALEIVQIDTEQLPESLRTSSRSADEPTPIVQDVNSRYATPNEVRRLDVGENWRIEDEDEPVLAPEPNPYALAMATDYSGGSDNVSTQYVEEFEQLFARAKAGFPGSTDRQISDAVYRIYEAKLLFSDLQLFYAFDLLLAEAPDSVELSEAQISAGYVETNEGFEASGATAGVSVTQLRANTKTIVEAAEVVYERLYYAYYEPIWAAQEQARVQQEALQTQIQLNKARIREETAERQRQRALEAQERRNAYLRQQQTIQESQRDLQRRMRENQQFLSP